MFYIMYTIIGPRQSEVELQRLHHEAEPGKGGEVAEERDALLVPRVVQIRDERDENDEG